MGAEVGLASSDPQEYFAGAGGGVGGRWILKDNQTCRKEKIYYSKVTCKFYYRYLDPKEGF